MSRSNVEALQRGLAAYDRRDVEALLEECHDDVEWESALVKGLGGETTVYRGHEGIRDLFREVDHAFDEFRIGFDGDDIRDLGDRIVASGWMRVRGRASGVAVESPVSFVADFRDGKATRFRSFLDRRDALAAAGLGD
jgi:ketosteroid isomerase-like protein